MFRGARLSAFFRPVFGVFIDAMTFLYLRFQSSSALAAENLFLGKPVTLFQRIRDFDCDFHSDARYTAEA